MSSLSDKLGSFIDKIAPPPHVETKKMENAIKLQNTMSQTAKTLKDGKA